MITREQVKNILENPADREWQVQGFGMLRTYLETPEGLPLDGEPRLQVWDQRLATWHNNAIHDHPWAFKSTIFAGVLFNQRYTITPHQLAWGTATAHVTEIIPGTRGGQLSEQPVKPCFIDPKPVEVYALGDTYAQGHREMHLTRYLQGTVTLIERSEREEADRARVAWYGDPDDQPPFVNPYSATPDVVERTVQMALEAWF